MGKRIVEELGPDQSVDTLPRWMAHYVAELIHSAETASGEDRQAKAAVCADAILSLWAHRVQFPKGMRPLEEIEPILRTLESLDLNNDPKRFYPSQIEIAEDE